MRKMQTEKRKLLSNIASLGVVQIVNYIFPLLTIPYVSRIIGPEGFGKINYSAAFMGYFILLVSYGFDFTATRKIAGRATDVKFIESIFIKVLNARLLLFLCTVPIFASCIMLVPMLRDNFWIAIIYYFSVFSNLLTPQYIFQGTQKLALFSRLNLLRGVVNTCLIFLFVNDADDILLYVGIGVVSTLSISILSLLYLKRWLNLGFKFTSLKSSFKYLWEERLMFFSTMVFSLYTTTNVVILGFFADITSVGFYTTAISFITIVQNVIHLPLSSSLYPFIGNSFAKGRQEGIDKLSRILPIVFYFCLAVGIGILVLGSFLVLIVYGQKFNGSIIIVHILSFLPLISGMSGLMGVQTMLNLQMDAIFLKITATGAIISIILNIVFANAFGYVGTGISYLITEILIATALFYTLKSNGIILFRHTNFKPKQIIALLSSLKNN